MRMAGRSSVVLGIVLATVAAAPAQQCEESFDSTFAMIETIVFERHGCTSATCHNAVDRAGELDLTRGAAYDNLIDQPPRSVPAELHPGLARVVPGFKGRSLLWLNVAAAALPELWQAPLRAMPLGGLPPLTSDELALIQEWIENGASRDGVVPGTAELFDACLPPAEPLTVKPLPPPPAGLGVQLRAPHQVLPPTSEREVCFVSYYDLTDQVPEEFRGADGTTFRYKRIDARQDPLSHHGVVIVYKGSTPITDPIWGAFACRGGARDGEACAPTAAGACGADGVCASPPTASVACIGFGPGNADIGTGETSLFNSMSAAATGGGQDGVYQEAPLRGILVWNSHAFNINDEPAGLDMWINFEFAAPEAQQRPLQRFVDISAIFKMNAPAFGATEVCNHHVMPARSQLLELASHTHKRGKRFRVFAGDFACQGGPNNGQPCSPYGPDPDLPVADPCAGAPCESKQPPRVGDCNGDLVVSVDELVVGVNIALDNAGATACVRFDGDESGGVTVEELVAAVQAAISPSMRDADASLLYTSLTYADPLILSFDPPNRFGGPHATTAERTLTYCAMYDNGFTHPEEVKRRSLTPTNGIPCTPTHCVEGAVGQPCTRDSQCNTPGADDGFCDACPVSFGVTTDDEMFVLTGSFVGE
jgi:hypothetical protein